MYFTENQEEVISKAVKWYLYSSEQIFQIAGNPGTGKSLVLNEIVKRLNLKQNEVAPMAYTGAASAVMRLKGMKNAKTIHSSLFKLEERQVLDSNGNPVYDTYFNKIKTTFKFVFKPLDPDKKIIVIDEGGSVPLSIKKYILSTGLKVLVAGDLDQLPPVADKPAFLYNGKINYLTTIMRQAKNSAIIELSQRCKRGLPIHKGVYNDVYVITDDEVTDDMLKISQVVLCGTNKKRDEINNHIRYDILKYDSPFPRFHEKIICRKNNWFIEKNGLNLTNGLSGFVNNSPSLSSYKDDSLIIDFLPIIDKSTIFDNIKINYKYLSASKEDRDIMKKSRFTKGNLFEYGYAQTVHLAQGTQYSSGMYFEEYLNRDINSKLNYTALTRFSKNCIYVKHKQKYY